MMNCVYCGKEIDPFLDFQLVVGWERLRPRATTKGKSLNGQRKKDKYACERCVEDLKKGRLGQETLGAPPRQMERRA